MASDDIELEKDNNIYLMELVDGYNLTYNYSCNYVDENGEIQSCLDQGIIDMSENLPY
jgi:hypothetical protein